MLGNGCYDHLINSMEECFFYRQLSIQEINYHNMHSLLQAGVKLIYSLRLENFTEILLKVESLAISTI